MKETVQKFSISGKVKEILPYGSGHINDTYLVTMEEGKRYILQRMNTEIFKNPEELMENICGVTAHLRRKIIERGGNPARETLNVIPAKDGRPYLKLREKEYYRMYDFVEDAVSLDAVRSPEDFYESAVSFGHFQAMLADYPARKLHETIPDFHNTVKRFQAFKQAVEADVCHRAAMAVEEIDFAAAREEQTHLLVDRIKSGELPLRVTHNDTKLNNIMIDRATGKGICVIDLDTVMPGSVLYDFGDSIRFGANTGEEDEKDLSKISLSLELFETYVKGYLEGCGGSLTRTELELLPMGAKMMTLECGIRFLTDYLQGDTYFKIHREGHNLDRCRTQFALVADMERKWAQMQEIVRKYC